MSTWPSIFRELRTTESFDVFNALNCVAVHVTTKVSFTKDSEAFFEAQMEPIPEGNTIAYKEQPQRTWPGIL